MCRALSRALAFLLSALTIVSCSKDRGENTSQLKIAAEKIEINDAEKFDIANRVDKKEFILLENGERSMFSNIDKMLVKGDKIYIMDVTGLHYIYVFDIKGKFIKRIGTLGDGPLEHRRIIDFDVDDFGNVLVLDYQRMKLRKYDSGGNPVNATEIPFRAYGFGILGPDRYIFSLTNEAGNDETEGFKIAITDSLLSVKSKYFSFKENDLDNKHSVGLFQRYKDETLFNKPVNDTLVVFGPTGEIKKMYKFDFGSRSVPEDMRLDYEKVTFHRKEGKMDYLYQSPMRIKNLMVGNLFSGSNKGIFMYDLVERRFARKAFDSNELSTDDINLPLTTYGDSTVFSYLDFGILDYLRKSDLPDDVIKHVKANEGRVVIRYTLK
jgi:hypothetical protein